ncbi:hypothetical protein B0H12DRAFT_777571 [Mycena haematopus]|nr:hypothetical protein B0H12DRAFT_777571 [Mycena haematopus]
MCAVWDMLRRHLQSFLSCFGLKRPPVGCGKSTVPDAHYALPHSSPTEFLRYTYVGRILRRLFNFPRAGASSALAPLIPLTHEDHNSHFYYITQYSHPRPTVLQPLLEFCRRPLQPLPLDRADICVHCTGETGCSLSTFHALGPCPCPNDHRFEQQTTSSAWHSLYCAKCCKHCFLCVGSSDIQA